MKPKKILIVTSEFPPLPGGIGNHALNLAKQLALNKYKVSVLTDQRLLGDDEFSHDQELNFKVIRTLLKKNRKLMYFKRIHQLFNLVKTNEIIIASGKFSLLIVALTSVFYNRKYIAVVHGTEVNLNSNFLMKLIKLSLKRMNLVVSVSNFTKSFLKDIKLQKSIVIPNGYTIESGEVNEKKLKGFPNLITVGRVSERKGQINVIEALPKIREIYPDVCYRMIGIPEDKQKLQERAEELGVLDHIIFYGKQEYDELYSILSSSDIFMMLSQNDDKGDIEGFGIAILEANHFSVPAVGSLGCGIEDAINNKSSGILVKPNDIEGVLGAIQGIINNNVNFKKLSKEWANNFTWDIIVKEYIKELECIK